jgi:hypothetical protein
VTKHNPAVSDVSNVDLSVPAFNKVYSFATPPIPQYDELEKSTKGKKSPIIDKTRRTSEPKARVLLLSVPKQRTCERGFHQISQQHVTFDKPINI